MDNQHLLNELQAHQIELEMQNEELRQAHLDLEASRNIYRDLYENAPVGYLTLDREGVIRAINLTGGRLLGVRREELLDQWFGRQVTDVDKDQWHIAFVKTCKSAQPEEFQLVLKRPGCEDWLARLHCVKNNDSPFNVRVTLTDLTAVQHIKTRLSFAATVFKHTREAIMITDAHGTIVDVNQAFSTITGYERDEALGMDHSFIVSEKGMADPYPIIWQELQRNHYWQGILWNKRRNGETYAARHTINAILGPMGELQNFVALFGDNTEAYEHQRQLEYVAHYDQLTKLPNRLLLAKLLNKEMQQVQARKQSLAVAYVDLDGFKAINDEYGHETGDKVLAAISRRMKKALVSSCTLARLGGDEFVAIIPDTKGSFASFSALNSLLSAASRPLTISGLELGLSASIGVSYYPQEADVSAEQLLRQGDQAMYQAKLMGKNRVNAFDSQHDINQRGYNAHIASIERALFDGQLCLFYQPKINLRTGAIVGAEALIRWRHPERGILLPHSFLPMIEGTQLASMIDAWVLDNALRQMQTWGFQRSLPVSINLSTCILQQESFVTDLTERLAAYPEIDPQMLTIEILETTALDDIDEVSHTIKMCGAIGVNFALDDFGTGYSSLSYLKKLPVTQLKIDQIFIKDMLQSNRDVFILRAILELAAAFGHEIIVEGVESQAQGRRLVELGCEIGQGFGIAEPMPAPEICKWIEKWEHQNPWQTDAVCVKHQAVAH